MKSIRQVVIDLDLVATRCLTEYADAVMGNFLRCTSSSHLPFFFLSSSVYLVVGKPELSKYTIQSLRDDLEDEEDDDMVLPCG